MPTAMPTRHSPPPHERTADMATPSPPPPSRVSHKVSSSSLQQAQGAAATSGSSQQAGQTSSHQVGTRQATRSRTRTRQVMQQQQANGTSAAGPSRMPMPRYNSEDHPLSAHKLSAKGYHSFTCLGVPFHVKKRYTFMRELGIGAYGCVALAHDSLLECNVAIKKVTRIFEREVLARRALREVAILRDIGICDNVTALLDFDTTFIEFNEIYLVLEASEADLSQIIRSGQALSDAHLQFFIAQILRGVRYMHAANIIHRDMKPGNLLVNGDCQLKLCDFGLARAFRDQTVTPPATDTDSPGVRAERSFPESPQVDRSQPPSPSERIAEMRPSQLRTTELDFPGGPLTEYVATRWYRAPEIMLCFKRGYGPSIDIWSVGCILAELLGGKPLFAGKDYVDQIARINNVLGSPPQSTIDKIGSERARTYVESLPSMPAVPFAKLYPNGNPQAVDLLTKMLCWDPDQRITAAEALQHPWLKAYHRSNGNYAPPQAFTRFDEVEMLQSIADFRMGLEREADEMRGELEALEAEQDDAEQVVDDGKSDRSGGMASARQSIALEPSSIATPSSLSSSTNDISPTYETDLTSISAPHSVAGSHSAGKGTRIRAVDGLGFLSNTTQGATGVRDRGREALDKSLAHHGLLCGDERELMRIERKGTFRRRAVSNAPSQAARLRRRGSEGSLRKLVKDAVSKAACAPISGSSGGLTAPTTIDGHDDADQTVGVAAEQDAEGAATAVHNALHSDHKTNDIIRRPTTQREGNFAVADETPGLLTWLSLSSTAWCRRRVAWMVKADEAAAAADDGRDACDGHATARDGSDTTAIGLHTPSIPTTAA